MDRKVKPLLYAEAAIPHFWRLEFEPAARLIVSELRGGRYVETVTALAGITTAIHAPFPVDLDPAGLARQQRSRGADSPTGLPTVSPSKSPTGTFTGAPTVRAGQPP
ncbi:hypothetical protein ACFWFU_04555 [Streptomyces sp. NPDC060235]|uniref:hypothetical protein n=1 Tax=Streptomyces sp. NPDC060235 TaxID=3347080 RepID=UPI003661D0E2